MNSFHNIKLLRHKGLKEGLLLDLGKINVVCGPNNSGKTTILECIADEKLHFDGKPLGADATERIDRYSMGDRHWTNPHCAEQYPIKLLETGASRPVWFKTDGNDFWLALLASWHQTFKLSSTPGSQSEVYTAFLREFDLAPSLVLIPAKRKLETSKRSAFDPTSSDGSGILNFLFSSKNQDATSPIRLKFDEISHAFEEISGGYQFEVFLQAPSGSRTPPPTIVDLLFRRRGGLTWVQAADCGLGLQEILIFLYFALASEHEVVLIEEPENHLHPEIQRRLIAFLREKTEKQFFLSTHSSVFLNTQFADRVFTCRMTDSVQIDNATSRATLLTELGYSIADNLVSDLVVLCEGPKDKLVLEEFFQKMGLLNRSNIKVWPLGGDIMDQLDLSVFQESHQLIALIDGDPGSSAVRKRFLTKCESLKIGVTQLNRYSIENYFSLAAIASVIKEPMPATITALDPRIRVSDQLGFEVKNCGGRIAKEMQLEDIKGTDLESFLEQVKSLINQPKNIASPST